MSHWTEPKLARCSTASNIPITSCMRAHSHIFRKPRRYLIWGHHQLSGHCRCLEKSLSKQFGALNAACRNSPSKANCQHFSHFSLCYLAKKCIIEVFVLRNLVGHKPLALPGMHPAGPRVKRLKPRRHRLHERSQVLSIMSWDVLHIVIVASGISTTSRMNCMSCMHVAHCVERRLRSWA